VVAARRVCSPSVRTDIPKRIAIILRLKVLRF
jgi:hypothetical protein